MTTADGQPGAQRPSSGQAEEASEATPSGPSVTLPEGVVLAKDERVLTSVEFPRSAVAFWVRSRFVLTDRRLIGRQANPTLILIPVGVLMCLSAFNAGFAVTTNAGQRREYPISSFKRNEALAFANRVNTAIAGRHA